MKKFVLFLLIATLGVALTSCSWFDSAPVNPKIIGVGNLEFSEDANSNFVVIDSVYYMIDNLKYPRDVKIGYTGSREGPSVVGKQVTVFTFSRKPGVQALIGNLSVEQIENLYRENRTIPMIALILMLSFLIYKIFNPSDML